MKNIVILAAGPPKNNRNRHLEVFNNQILISSVIESCTIENTNLYVVVNSKNIELENYIKSLEAGITILKPDNNSIQSTFKTALSVSGDCIMVCGDLINTSKKDIMKFVNTEYDSALCHYKMPWGQNIISSDNSLIRRSDIGDCIVKISEDSKSYFLGEENYRNAILNFKKFYPYKILNENVYNDIGTHLMFSFFKEIWSKPGTMSSKNIGVVTFENKIYQDND